MSLSIIHSRSKIKTLYAASVLAIVLKPSAALPVSPRSRSGRRLATIEKCFLLLIDCAVRNDLPAVFLILRLLCPERIPFEVFLSDVCFTNPFFFHGAFPDGQSCSFACRNGSLILIYRHRVKSVCKSLNSHWELSLC